MTSSETTVGVLLFPPTWGGLHSLVTDLASPLREFGVHLRAILPTELDEQIATRLVGSGIPVSTLPLHRVQRDLRADARAAGTMARQVRALRRELRSSGVDVLHTFGLMQPHAFLATTGGGTPLVVSLNSTMAPSPLRRVAPLLLRRAGAVLVEGSGVAAAHRLSPREVSCFYPSIGATTMAYDGEARQRVRASLGIPQNATVVGTVGNRTWQKAHEHLVRAAATLSGDDLWFLVVGSPVESSAAYYQREVVGLARSLGLTERFVFHAAPRSQMAGVYSAIDVFTLTSRAEGVATSTLEAMACGRPVVAFEVGSVRDVVTPEVGVLVPPDDAPALAASLRRLTRDPRIRAQMGRSARDRLLTHFPASACVAAHAEAYRRSLGAPR